MILTIVIDDNTILTYKNVTANICDVRFVNKVLSMLNQTKISQTQTQSIETAISLLGGQSELAQKLGLKSQGTISQWVTGRRPLPAIHCRKIEELTDGKVTRYELRPDVFGDSDLSQNNVA